MDGRGFDVSVAEGRSFLDQNLPREDLGGSLYTNPVSDLAGDHQVTTSGSVGLSTACMCGNSCMSRDSGYQAVRAAGKNYRFVPFQKQNTFL